ncbi:MAG TPA: TorF family putative porin, partial [Gammaproteobacteria bacterium]|nr:TorF family putative porin [Gammaproteobacteria bacterium]
MPHYLVSLLGVLLVNSALNVTMGAEISASLSYATDYTVLGISRSQGEGVFQGGLNLDTESGFYASLWASQVEYSVVSSNPDTGNPNTNYPYTDYPTDYQDERDLELDLYLGYRQAIAPGWRSEIMLAHYTYPGATSTRDWAYTELLLAMHYRNRASVALGISKNLFGRSQLTRSLAVNTRLFTWQGVTGSAGAGYVDAAALPAGYAYWQAAVARQFGAVRTSL